MEKIQEVSKRMFKLENKITMLNPESQCKKNVSDGDDDVLIDLHVPKID